MKLGLILALATLALAHPPPPAQCPQCKPLPPDNQCHITTSCTFNWGHTGPGAAPYYCACRHGYRATGYDPKDTSIQWRLPWYAGPNGQPSQEGRVFVKPGVNCDTLCDKWYDGAKGCQEVQLRSNCM
ncbi:hypothetical protein BU26DRAFT_502849 [Trematosphaeria pertusa]|uniref:Uncharacterized protein n=1 Tax=Trematosphaeria pertusa TaxID=390896 RepID=A0A6A6IQ26_9PLEO|nr:uncharacterized protein BU26DRAFT_502849 [Trematosphaeria pertusa]KAF2252369.1 hypothetical protein BU26DRAFT_502849 [Trematosphaeria pertusa]